MGVACAKCGNEDLRVDPISRFRLGIPHLSELQQSVVVLSCRPCASSFQVRIPGRNRPGFSHFMHVPGRRRIRAGWPAKGLHFVVA